MTFDPLSISQDDHLALRKAAEATWAGEALHPQYSEEIGTLLNLVNDDQPAQSFQGEHGLRKTREILIILEVEEGDGAAPRLGDHPRQSGFSHLPCAENAHDDMPAEHACQDRHRFGPRFHVCIYTMKNRR